MKSLPSLAKSTIQTIAKQLGYRVVPKCRDAQTLLTYIEKQPVSAVIDVGANCGDTCLHWLRTYPGVQVHAFEALDIYNDSLNEIKKNYSYRFQIWNFAASDQEETLIFHRHDDHPSSSSILSSTDDSHKLMPFTRVTTELHVNAKTIDSVLINEEEKLGSNILLKLDVQGAELKVLKGSNKLLEKTKYILCEINLQNLYNGQASFQEILIFLNERNFHFSGFAEQFHTNEGIPVYLDAIFMKR